jgi:hypothetical protein
MDIITRQQALEQGLTYYFTGKPCKHGHIAKRVTKKCQCHTCYRQGIDSWNTRNKEKVAEDARKRAAKHWADTKDKRLAKRREYLAENPGYKIRKSLANRMRAVLQGNVKSAATLQLVGCTAKDLQRHIEAQFLPGMSWENYGPKGWHVDHIRPCASFDLTDPAQQRICFHWSNLQPLWAIDNIRKGAKLVA